MTLYGKIDTLVVNDRTWDRLPDDARTALTKAAHDTRDWLVQTRPREDGTTRHRLRRGQRGRPGRASGGRRDQTGDRTPPRAMLADPQVGPTIRRIEALKADLPVDPLVTPECQSRGPAADIGTPIDPAVLDGTYRTTFTEQELLDAGTDEQSVHSIAACPLDHHARRWALLRPGGRLHGDLSRCRGR